MNKAGDEYGTALMVHLIEPGASRYIPIQTERACSGSRGSCYLLKALFWLLGIDLTSQ